jgi:hypothetical protein
MEVRPTVVIEVNGLDGHFDGSAATAAEVREYAHLILISLAWQRPKHGKYASRQPAKAGLCVPQANSGQCTEYFACEQVAQAAPQWDVCGKDTCAKHHALRRFREGLSDMEDVSNGVLAVGVCSNDASYLRQVGEYILEAGLERTAFAEVDCVAEESDTACLLKLLEDSAAVVAAAIVHHKDGPKAGSSELLNQFDEDRFWLPSRNEYDQIGKAFSSR